MKRFLLASLAVAGPGFGAAPVEHPSFSDADVDFFTDEVRPILEQNCVKCHGGTDGRGKVKIKSGLQLISRRGIVVGGDHGPAFDAGDPDRSLLLHVTSYEDENLKMPPRGKLPAEERAVLEEWVRRGLPWTPDDIDFLHDVHEENSDITAVNETTRAFWSYKRLERPEVPEVDDPAWGRNPVDAFLHEALAREGLKPNGPAGRRELIRRATYGLTGLPPTLAEVRVFENDESPDAWEKVVDRLLASPHYGEKWARHWLDVVRYAESNGFERDSEKPHIWRYRDYVIGAFNEDKPYDRFLLEQLAGDEIDGVTPASMIATGYHRLMQWDDEPADKLQHMFDNLDDNVRITSEGMLGMTLGCARCHDHKGDPISQEDYYSFMAFFRGVKPPGKGNANVEKVEAAGNEAHYEKALARHREQERVHAAELEKVEAGILAQLAKADPRVAARIGGKAGGAGAVVADARGGKPAKWRYTTTRPAGDWSAVGFRAGDAGWKEGPAGFGTRGTSGARIGTAWKTPGLWVQTTFLLESIPKAAVITLHHDEDVEVFLNGQPVLQRKGRLKDYLEIAADRTFLTALQTGRNVIAAHVRQTGGGQYFDLGLALSGKGGLTIDEALGTAAGKTVDAALVKRRRDLRGRLARLAKAVPRPGIDANVVQEAGKTPPPLHVHIRGNANAKSDTVVTTRIPSIFGGTALDAEPPANGRNSSGRRLALAGWITRPDNPRTSRVMANRIWQHHFGAGLCPTPNDFGYLGERPSHPELLDWLATEFVKRGWSMKAMHKLIMMSEAYRMSSRGQVAGLGKDPANKWLWRFNLRRLTAEEVRDSILAATGALNPEMGGPSVYIKLPEAVLATSSTKGGKWGKSPPEDQVRRSVYLKVKRSLVPPMLTDFDLSDTDNTCPVRFRSILPTQALALLNSDFANTEAGNFAARLRAMAPDDPRRRVRLGFELALSRTATEREIDYGVEFIETMVREHRLSEEKAFDRFALLVLNLNEFMFLD